MSITIPTVQPGDLIKADTWNYLIQQLIALDARVAALESITPGGGNTFAITGLSQTSLRVGDTLTVFGINFGPAFTNTVWINSFPVPASAFDTVNSTPKQLIFTIPAITGLPSTGATVTMQVSTPHGADSRQFFLAPFVGSLPSGTVTISQAQWQDTIDPITSATPNMVTFNVHALVNLPETYTLSASTTFPGASATVVDNSGNKLTQIQLQAMKTTDTPVPIRVQLTIPASSNGTSGTVTLNVASVNNPSGVSMQTATPQTFSFGSLPPHPGNISVLLSPAPPATASGGVMSLPPGVQCAVQGQLLLPANAPTGTYTITATAAAPAGWTFARLPVSIPFASGAGNPNFTFALTGAAGTATATSVTVTLTGPTSDFNGQQSFQIKLQ